MNFRFYIYTFLVGTLVGAVPTFLLTNSKEPVTITKTEWKTVYKDKIVKEYIERESCKLTDRNIEETTTKPDGTVVTKKIVEKEQEKINEKSETITKETEKQEVKTVEKQDFKPFSLGVEFKNSFEIGSESLIKSNYEGFSLNGVYYKDSLGVGVGVDFDKDFNVDSINLGVHVRF